MSLVVVTVPLLTVTVYVPADKLLNVALDWYWPLPILYS